MLIALTGAGVVQRTSFRESRLHEYMQPASQAFVNQLNAMTGFFGSMSGSAADAQNLAQASIYQQLNQLASVMAYQDTIAFFARFRFYWFWLASW